MIKFICFLLAFAPCLSFSKDVYVKGYTRKDGTHVEGYYRTAPNGTMNDNFSTYGNVNPYTREPGRKKIYSNNSHYVLVQSGQIYQESYEVINTTKYDANCKTNDGESFSIEFDENILIAKGKYKASRSSSGSKSWALYSNKGFNYFLGNVINEKMPIKLTNKWGGNTLGSCIIKQRP